MGHSHAEKMTYIIGIDTGGTYTDAILLDTRQKGPDCVARKSKAFTCHEKLEKGISESIKSLNLDEQTIKRVERVVLSTTLATNAIVENKLKDVGLIIIGDPPHGQIATGTIEVVEGHVNIKGRVTKNLNTDGALETIERIVPNVEAIAISAAQSTKNPSLEQEVKKMVQRMSEKPVICGHEMVNELGFLERTNTAVINAGLLPIINNFITAVQDVLKDFRITAPVFVVRGDGSIAKLDSLKNKPIDTLLSGPASSMIGTIALTGIDNAIVSDMGGTTTDIGIVKNKRIELSNNGATIGGWKVRVKSAKLYTFGLGGDSEITTSPNGLKVGPRRILPACRAGGEVVTPTDILHYTGDFKKWENSLAIKAIEKQAHLIGKTSDEYVDEAINIIIEKIADENTKHFLKDINVICAIGAPAESWYTRAKQKYLFDLIIPENFEVANAVGAATAGVYEEAITEVRKGEEGRGFLVFTQDQRYFCQKKNEAIDRAIDEAEKQATKKIEQQHLELADKYISCEHTYMNGGELEKKEIYSEIDKDVNFYAEGMQGDYMRTIVKVQVSGKIFVDNKLKM